MIVMSAGQLKEQELYVTSYAVAGALLGIPTGLAIGALFGAATYIANHLTCEYLNGMCRQIQTENSLVSKIVSAAKFLVPYAIAWGVLAVASVPLALKQVAILVCVGSVILVNRI